MSNETKATGTATFIRPLPREDWSGIASLYKVSPPISFEEWVGDERRPAETEYVVVSATTDMITGPQTYIFPADEAGEVRNLSELDGSYRGGFDHSEALEGAGYALVKAPQ